MKIVLVFTLSLLFSISAYAQIEPAATQNPGITKEELDGALRDATSSLKAQMQRSERAAAALLAREREEVEKKEERRHAAQLAAQQRLESELLKTQQLQQEREAQEIKRANNIRKSIYGVAGFLIISGLCLGAFVARRYTKPVEVRVDHTHSVSTEPLTDPDIPALRSMAKKSGKVLVPFYITLERENLRLLCIAKVLEDKKPLIVSIENQETNIGWDDRKKKISTEISRRKQA